jgi:hypothetical protein
MFKSGKLDKAIQGDEPLDGLGLSDRLGSLLKKARELNQEASSRKEKSLNIRINISNMQGDYIYQLYSVDSSCSKGCVFAPVEEKEVSVNKAYQQIQELSPYSVKLIVLRKKTTEKKD